VSPRRERDPDHARRQAAALLLNRVVLGLLDDARRRGGFGEDEKALTARATELAVRLAANSGAKPDLPEVELKLRSGGRIEIEVRLADGVHAHAGLREDGYVLSGGTGGPEQSWGPIDLSDLTDKERAAKERQDRAYELSRGKPAFRRKRYDRTIAAPTQPTATVRILAAGFYADGLVVHYTYDVPELTDEELLREAERPYADAPPLISIADDLGTDYYESGGASYGGGPGASHSHQGFAPAVSATATVLHVTTDDGTVDIPLTD
jgi:hypothetical protein